MRKLVALVLLLGVLLPLRGADGAEDGVIGRDAAGNLTLNGSVYKFDGVNAYELGSLWGTNAGCGGPVADLDALFSKLRPNSLVRFWATQQVGTNINTKQTDWTALDRIFAAAEKYGQRLIPTLADQWGACDTGHWKDSAWYRGEYATRVFDDDHVGASPLTYAQWVDRVVPRYRDHPALGMWELVNEPEATDCTDGYTSNCWGHTTCTESTARAALRSFFDTEAVHVKTLDPRHLVSFGAIGSGQCGLQGEDYQYVGASSGIDVLTIHDYGYDSTALPGWIPTRIGYARNLSKPIFTEEVGIRAVADGSGCVNLWQRKELLKSKLTAQLDAGMSGFVPWNWMPAPNPGCSLDIGPWDSTMRMLRHVPLS